MTDERMKRLELPKLAAERQTLEAMVGNYCRRHHGTDGRALCPSCRDFLAYALKRLACCPFGEEKPVCAKCRIHCYRKAEKALACRIMREEGPRLVVTHPVLSFEHLIKSLTVTPPEKPKNKTQRVAADENRKP